MLQSPLVSHPHKLKGSCKLTVSFPVAGQLLPTNYSSASHQAPNAPDAKAVLDLSTTDVKQQPNNSSDSRSPPPKSPPHRIQDLHVDRVLARAQRPRSAGRKTAEDLVFVPVSVLPSSPRQNQSLMNDQRNGIFGKPRLDNSRCSNSLTDIGGRNSLSFFSDSRLLSLSTRLRNNKVNELVGRISTVVNGRLRRGDATTTTRRIQQPESVTDRSKVALYVRRMYLVAS